MDLIEMLSSLVSVRFDTRFYSVFTDFIYEFRL